MCDQEFEVRICSKLRMSLVFQYVLSQDIWEAASWELLIRPRNGIFLVRYVLAYHAYPRHVYFITKSINNSTEVDPEN